ncbi:MAG: N-6 DNA methylase [bacterium]|nr:N-6 DNA methylase [bacterium]
MKVDVSQSYISRHKKYIDYRISSICNYVSLGKNIPGTRPLLDDIVDYLVGSKAELPLLKNNPDEFVSSLEELYQLVSSWDILNDGDVVGYIYQEIQGRSKRKSKGQYFTPGDIVNDLASKTVERVLDSSKCPETIKVLDPACGSGQFLIAVYKQLLDLYIKQGIEPELAAVSIVENNIFGTDIDPIAISIARYNLARISGSDAAAININHTDFLLRDDLNFYNKHLKGHFFDLVISNPPWGSSLTNQEKRYFRKEYESGKSGLNTFTLFVERAFDYLKEKGVVAFLIPEAYLNIKAHRSSREFVLANAVISDLAIWGEKFKGVFAPSISIILKQEEDIQERDRSIVNIISNKKAEMNTATLVPQASFHRTAENIFNINYSRKAVNIISSIQDQHCLYLKNQSRFFLGVVTGNNSRHIVTDRNEEHPDPIIIGKDISQYKINYSDHYFKYNPEILQQVAPQHLYLTRNKILYKFIGKRLTFALEDEGFYSLNNVNGFIPEFHAINSESLVSILNSKVIQYYYQKNFFTVKVLRGNLERLPLKIISKSGQKKLKKLTLSLADSSSIENAYATTCRENIEDIIYYEYGISDKEAYIIGDEAH